MTSLIIFDLDGVLVDSKDLHYQALNMAIAEINPNWVINYQEHLQKYDGNPTSVKLDMLSKKYPLLNKKNRNIIANKKQIFTKLLIKQISVDKDLVHIMKYIKKNGINIAVASNSIRSTVEDITKSLGIYPYIGYIASNEDVVNPKPDPEIYIKCMDYFGARPDDTMILEDSEIGKAGALASGGRLVPIKNRKDVTLKMIKAKIENKTYLNVVIPMAGAGNRFSELGYTLPKPLIQINGKPMIQAVLESLNINIPNVKYTFIVQKKHYEQYDLFQKLSSFVDSPNIILLDKITDGAAVTVLFAKNIINNDTPLIIANSDQIVEWDSEDFISIVKNNAAIALFTDNKKNPKWSFAKIDNNLILDVAEKNPISNYATVGIYGWSKGAEYVKYAEQMISKNIKTNNEFYIAPVYNEAILDNVKVVPYFVDRMYGIGTPEDLKIYLENNHD